MMPGYLTSGSSIVKTDDMGATFSLDRSQSDNYNHIGMRTVELGGNNWVVGWAVGDNDTITKDGRNSAGENVSSGVYFYRLEATTDAGLSYVNLRKMVMMK